MKNATFPCKLCLVQSIPSKDLRVSGERFGISTVTLFFRMDCRNYFCTRFWTTTTGQNGLFRIFGFHFSSGYLRLFPGSMWYFIHFQFAQIYRCVSWCERLWKALKYIWPLKCLDKKKKEKKNTDVNWPHQHSCKVCLKSTYVERQSL